LTCSTCHQVARIRAAFHLFEKRIRPSAGHQIYITEQVTSLYHILKSRHPRLVGSEFLIDSTPAGKVNKSGVRSEDLTALSFPDAHFDHLLTFEVLEHIPDYQAALRECARVLRPGGKFFCTVPFHGHEKHYIRARLLEDGSIEHLLPPEYHGNPLDSAGSLCYRYFGLEFLDDLRAAGFSDAFVWTYWSPEDGYVGTDRSVFVAVR
jgi:SAM-dependent methyltransferase